MSDNDRLRVSLDGPIATVALNRPSAHNGLDLAMLEGLRAVAEQLRRHRDVRAVVLHGEGPSFCAGLDFKSLAAERSALWQLFAKWPWQACNPVQRAAHCWRTLPIPVIAAVHGNCFGGGLQIACAADFRVCTAATKWSVMEARWGLVPDMSGSIALSRLLRHDQAQWLAMSGEVIDGTRALEIGLVTHLANQPLTRAQQMAATLAGHSPDALAATKQLLNRNWCSGHWAALWRERWAQIPLLLGANHHLARRDEGAQAPRPYQPRRSLFSRRSGRS